MIGILSFLQHKTALIDILIAHHLSIVADLEPENAEQTRRDCFKYIDEAIDIFMRVSTITVTARKQRTFLLTLKPFPSSQMGSFFFFFKLYIQWLLPAKLSCKDLLIENSHQCELGMLTSRARSPEVKNYLVQTLVLVISARLL